MTDPAFLEQIVADSEARAWPELTPRRVRLADLPGKADAIVGMRRVGKTSLAQSVLAAEARCGLPRERMLYVNFEDERLWQAEALDLTALLDTFYRRNPMAREERSVIVLDEIQNVPGWEKFVRRILDTEDVRVVLTGSSAKLLSSEIATALRGRSVATELFPFAFDEALVHASTQLPDKRPGAKQRSAIEAAFDSYLERGGFPEIQGVSEPLRRRVLQDYLQVALLRDIIERHEVSSVGVLRAMSRQLLANPGGLMSVTKLHRDLRSRGHRVGKDTLYDFVDFFEDAYLFFPLPIFTDSERVRQVHPRKFYPVDAGLVTACAPRTGAGTGHLLETLVFIELRRTNMPLGYFRHDDGTEVDFVVDEGGELELIQVSADITSSDTRGREVRALRAAMGELSVRQATIVTLRAEETFDVEEGTISVVPAWLWTLRRAGFAR